MKRLRINFTATRWLLTAPDEIVRATRARIERAYRRTPREPTTERLYAEYLRHKSEIEMEARREDEAKWRE